MKNFTALCAIAVLVLSSCSNVSNAPMSTADSSKNHIDSAAKMTHSVIVTDSTKHIDSAKHK